MNEMQLENIKKLLNDVGEKIEKSKEIARLKGEKFNIFSILGIETKENKTHSNFLVSLLNPNGEHGLGDVFLQHFYDTIISKESGISLTDDKRQIIDCLKQEKVDVKTEFHLGKTNYNEVEGGRVDISLKGNKGEIFIENKIYAGDQHLQIARYIKGKKAVVFYLTLFGNEPSKESSGNYKVNEDFFILSYKIDIKIWLEKCQKEASDFPIIRETIKQYLILIKKLTGQLTSNEMESKIHTAILKNLDAANVISNNIEKAKANVKNEFVEMIRKNILTRTNAFEIIIQEGKNWVFLSIRDKKWHKDLKYHFEISPKNGCTYFGVVLNNKKEKWKQNGLFLQMENILGKYYNNAWGWISHAIEICIFNNQFINDFYTKNPSKKETYINIIADKITEYINNLNEKVKKVDVLLKEQDSSLNTINELPSLQ